MELGGNVVLVVNRGMTDDENIAYTRKSSEPDECQT